MATVAHQLEGLTCPSCPEPVVYEGTELRCPVCEETVPIVDGIPQYPLAVDDSSTTELFDVISPIYETPLWFPLMYRLVGGLAAPSDDLDQLTAFLEPDYGHVLDAACGTGRLTRRLAPQARLVTGIDVSEGMLERAQRYAARRNIANVQFIRMGVGDLRFENDQFDTVVCGWALHLFPDIPGALEELHRVLKPGGQVAGTTLTQQYILSNPVIRAGLSHSVGAHVFAEDELRNVLHDIGFESLDCKTTGGVLFFGGRG